MKKSTPKFDFYEKVRIVSTDGLLNGQLGAVLGQSQDDDGLWHYGVHVYSQKIGFFFSEKELTVTGEFSERQEFYDDSPDSSVRVHVDEEGKGHIID